MNGTPPNSDGTRVEVIFQAALELDAAQRPAYLDSACGGDERLRRRAEALLRAAEANPVFLPEQPNPNLVAQGQGNTAAVTEKPGDRIGRYTLLAQVGVGGFGVVFKAQQEEPIRRIVALKIVKLGMDTRDVIARFEAERQTLAMMDHPNIARVLDAGATDTGRPYFVMELVNGVSITQYCDSQRLSMPRRLEMFTQVCRAVQHAHEKGVIHRDLKPSNVLVSIQDGMAVPKVIDFGIAKATAQSLALSTVATALGVLGTPAYMSPEQADLRRADIDTRSDIYSLGVLLYELLTGQPPFQPSELVRLALDELLRTIREEEPPRPSTCLLKLAKQKLTDTAELRETEPSKLAGLLRGDLDCIVMKCLEKDRAQRYDSASGLAKDVQRYLENEPIAALPPSTIYRFRKLVRRHRLAFAIGMAALAMVLAAGLYWWFLPGTLNLDVTPADVGIDIDGRDYAGGPMPRQITLSPGPHQLRFHKPAFSDELRVALVPRNGFASVPHLALRHEEGILDVASSPPGSGIGSEGVDYFGSITERPTDTGSHELIGFADGCFEVRHEVNVRRGERTTDRLSLENGVSWKYSSPGIQDVLIIITNTPAGEPPVILNNELNRIVFLSSANGMVLGTIPTPDGNVNSLTTAVLGADEGRVILSGIDDPRVGPSLTAWADAWPTHPLWKWGPPVEYRAAKGMPMGLSITAVPNANGVANIAFAGRDGRVRVANGRTGALEHEILLATNAPIGSPEIVAWNQDGRSLLLALILTPTTNSAGLDVFSIEAVGCDVAAESVLWRQDFGIVDYWRLVDFNSHGRPWLALADESRWRLIDPLTGETKNAQMLPGRLGNGFGLAKIEHESASDLILQFADPSLPMMAVRPIDGTTIWRGPTNLTKFRYNSADCNMAQTRNGVMLVALRDRFVAIQSLTGSVLWEIPGSPVNLRMDERTDDMYVTFADRRLFCLDSAGRTNWILRLTEEVNPRIIMPAMSGGGPGEILLNGHSSIIETVHWPRLLWEAQADGPLQATPLVVRDPVGNAVVVQLGPWKDGTHMLGLHGPTGRTLWSNQEYFSPNRAPALGTMDKSGATEVATIGEMPERRLIIRTAADGKLVRYPQTAFDGWFTGGLAADFRGIGKSDVAVSTMAKPRIALLDSRTGEILWEHPTEQPNMGALAAADLDGDSLPDVVATSFDGHVYALRGKDGRLLWKTASTNYPSGSPPTVADLNGDGKLQVLLTTEPSDEASDKPAGGLFALNAADGSQVWSPRMGIGRRIAGRVTVTTLQGHKLILAPMGTNGVVAFAWPGGTEIWRSPRGFPVITTPVVSDLAHDGSHQVVIGATTGDVIVVDLADGKPLWQSKVAQKTIEADPVAADLNNDGVDDILVASHDFHLYAIDGRAIVGHSGSRR